MNDIKFYLLENNYINYLRKFDRKIPQISSTSNSKPYCGIVFLINDFYYFAPLSSFRTKQATNFIIKDIDNNTPISSLRFCFMLPIPKDKFNNIVTLYDFSRETDSKYRLLLEKEYNYCKLNKSRIFKLAQRVYYIGINRTTSLSDSCCDFKKLEKKCLFYLEK
jgi:hypothetical protein